jgi:ArsR family transcriptional regulator
MLAYARMKLERAGLSHAQVRHGDLHNVPLPDGSADAVVLHQVLHFLDDPAAALAEAARLLAPGGKLLVVDFAPHELEFLREQSAHRRLGFAREQIGRLLESAGLKLERFRELKPAPSGGKLTVSLWLGSKPAFASKKRKAGPKVEAAA